MSFLYSQQKERNSQEEEEFFQHQKEINPYLQRFHNRSLENEYLASTILQYKKAGYLICIIQVIIMIDDFLDLFWENIFPQKKLIYLLILITLDIIVFVLLHFKSSWFNFTFFAYFIIYITMNAWYTSDTDLLSVCDSTSESADHISYGYVISAFLALGINGSSYILKSILFLLGTCVIYFTQLARTGYSFQLMVQMILVVLLYIYMSHLREHELRCSFLKRKQVEQFNTIINNQIPHCLFAAKFNQNEQRIELFKCNSRAQKTFNINNGDDFERFISETYLLSSSSSTGKTQKRCPSSFGQADNDMDRSCQAQQITDKKQAWENSLKGQIRQLIEQKITLENSNPMQGFQEGPRPRQSTMPKYNDKSAIFKLQLRMQEGMQQDNKLSVRLSIFKLHECYVIITVDKWKKKKSQKNTQQHISNNNYGIKKKQPSVNTERYRRATHQVEVAQTPSTLMNPEVASPEQRVHAPTMPNRVDPSSQINHAPFSMLTNENSIPLLTSVALTAAGSTTVFGQVKQQTILITEEDHGRTTPTPSQFALTNHNIITQVHKGVQPSQHKVSIQQSPPLAGVAQTSRQSNFSIQQIRQHAISTPTNNTTSLPVSPNLFPVPAAQHLGSKKLRKPALSNTLPQQVSPPAGQISFEMAQQIGPSNPQILPLSSISTVSNQSNNNSFHGSIPSIQYLLKDPTYKACLEIISSTIELIKRYKRHFEGIKMKSREYALDVLCPSSEPIEQYTLSTFSQILLNISNFTKFYTLSIANKPVSISTFQISSIILHLKNRLQPLLIDRNIRLLLQQEDIEMEANTDQNLLAIVLINLIFYVASHLQDASFVAVKFSIAEQNQLRVQLTMPHWEGHPFANIEALNNLHPNMADQSVKLMVDLRVAFGLLKILNFGNQNTSQYAKFVEGAQQTHNMCLSFTLPMNEGAPLLTQAGSEIQNKDPLLQTEQNQSHILGRNSEGDYSPKNLKQDSMENRISDECYVEESMISLDRWVSHQHFLSFQSPRQFKFML